ncbi:biotin/lipoate--protein ligase family protein [Paracraurococcus lichenis]|uniref:Biotin/lipoate--protein ligase family protein n=1 Tax=Paracraurococcus lichenis TaxID=3064888 RepID=A0ABT9DWM3_9PROT|nr:biotin/lipoate--protein ligase family protein [Paracraurococcus sp. LOR1-02]MDO9708195.1 biotin/lipoate--protein ligase family protein [Paracraurococcus sp. LOR1-02]
MPIHVLPDLPTVFRPVPLREGGDALARAVALAPEQGAGTLAWVGSAARAEAAVVLEPEMPLAAARLALLAAANALADALGAFGPPEVPVEFLWPGRLLVNGAGCGQVRLAAPPGTAEDAVPDWLVVGMEARITLTLPLEPGEVPDLTGLLEEGWEDISVPDLTAAWARHLMAALDDWQAKGPARLAERYLARLRDERDVPGLRRGIDPATGDLVLDRDGARQRRRLAP